MEAIMDLAIFLYIGVIYLFFNEVYIIYKSIEDKQHLSKDHLWEHILILSLQGILKVGIIFFILVKLDMETLLEIQVYIPLGMATLGSFLGVQHFKKERKGEI